MNYMTTHKCRLTGHVVVRTDYCYLWGEEKHIFLETTNYKHNESAF